ncbi:hypothetical protein [Nocardioides sp. Kera G14]|uniref:HD domain-containing protein n=1 Tax=Nocardioides sp. Kera G14 TaxID=2884264 RepID=UPI001D0F9EAA|nr:hypothetical protein [Nocardioides sp. Kera G14]UDY24216.1 hypothetical protein LH076_02655 [Nocardioides sp. Kera G14]
MADADPLRDELLTAYAAPDRRFHGIRHLREVLEHLVELASEGTPFDPEPVTLAAWFHDSVYDGERDSEERAAAWAREALPDHVSEETVEEVARLVLLTETHQPEAGDKNGAALCDADLAILADSASRYGDYVASVRAEFGHLEDAEFTEGRTHLIEKLLDRPTIFHTAHGRAVWEAAARTNLADELAQLQGR